MALPNWAELPPNQHGMAPMENMPPEQMWIVENGVKTRYYRTFAPYVQWVSKNKYRIQKIWYCDFTSIYPHWKEIPVEDWP